MILISNKDRDDIDRLLSVCTDYVKTVQSTKTRGRYKEADLLRRIGLMQKKLHNKKNSQV